MKIQMVGSLLRQRHPTYYATRGRAGKIREKKDISKIFMTENFSRGEKGGTFLKRRKKTTHQRE